jgi:predicted PurR-regulated permease PerM
LPARPNGAVRHVIVDDPAAFKTGNVLWAGSMGAMGYVVQAAMVLFLVFFLLLSGDTYKRKLVRLTGPSLSRKKITIQVLDDINRSIQRYMLMLLSTNVLVALLAWMAFRWIGLDNAGAWAVAAGLMHLVPYLGPGLVAIATGMVAWIQFDSFVMAFLVAGVWLAIAVTHVAQCANHRHREGRVRACRALAAGGRVAGRVIGKPHPVALYASGQNQP